jgi:hypothetical protein
MAVTRKSLVTKFPANQKSVVKITQHKKSILIDTQELFSRIQKRAYELYILRGCGHGLDKVDWFEAQRLILLECEHGEF